MLVSSANKKNINFFYTFSNYLVLWRWEKEMSQGLNLAVPHYTIVREFELILPIETDLYLVNKNELNQLRTFVLMS